MTKTERMLFFLRLLKTHRDGLTRDELTALLELKPSAFYNYLGALRRMSFDIQCRADGKYILVLDKKAEKMLIDYFPDLLVKPDRKEFNLKQDFDKRYEKIYMVEIKCTGDIHFFRELPGICAMFPELSKYSIYFHRGNFENETYRIKSGPLMVYLDSREKHKKHIRKKL